MRSFLSVDSIQIMDNFTSWIRKFYWNGLSYRNYGINIPLIISNLSSQFGFTVPALSLFRPFVKLQFMFPIKVRNLIQFFFGNVDKNQMALTFFCHLI